MTVEPGPFDLASCSKSIHRLFPPQKLMGEFGGNEVHTPFHILSGNPGIYIVTLHLTIQELFLYASA